LLHHDFNFWGKWRIVKFTRCTRFEHFFDKLEFSAHEN
jgi:hypothetical protein